MIAPIGELFSPPTQPVRRPSRDSAYATLYSPPPTQTSSSGANSIRPCCGGDRRSMHSPRLTRSYLQSFRSRIFIMDRFLYLTSGGATKARRRERRTRRNQLKHQILLR